MKIKSINGFEVIDSRGNPTVGARVILDSDISGIAMVPSGASTGQHEANEKRDQEKTRYFGKGVLKAVESIDKEISNLLRGKNVEDILSNDQLMIDEDGTNNKSNFGANSILAVSLATAKAAANSKNLPLYEFINDKYSELSGEKVMPTLPIPMMNILNGGAHADNPIDFQEFMIQPRGFNSFTESLRAGIEIFHTLKDILKSKGLNTAVGDEGGFAPDLKTNEEALDTILEAIMSVGLKEGKDIVLALDVASSEFYKDGYYHLDSENRKFNSEEFSHYLEHLVKTYPIISIEDGMGESDWIGWKILSDKLGHKIQLVGDDLFVTNKKILQDGIDKEIANSILIKPNQIGTITETIEAIDLAVDSNYTAIISHRSGETSDTSISDIAVGTRASQIKTGSLSRSDRIAKYNQLLRIEERLGNKATFDAKNAFAIPFVNNDT